MIIRHVSLSAFLLGTAMLASTPAALAQCDISQTRCAVNGGKCNIKFRNRTGISNGSDGGTSLKQSSSAQTVQVKARKANKEKAGNKLSIVAGTSGTMNFDKKAKKSFEDVQLSSADITQVKPVIMSCEDVRAVLNGNGTCKVFHGEDSSSGLDWTFYLGYQCDGGNVAGPKP